MASGSFGLGSDVGRDICRPASLAAGPHHMVMLGFPDVAVSNLPTACHDIVKAPTNTRRKEGPEREWARRLAKYIGFWMTVVFVCVRTVRPPCGGVQGLFQYSLRELRNNV